MTVRTLALVTAILAAACAAPPEVLPGPVPEEATLPGKPAIPWSPEVYRCPRAPAPPVVDGRLSDACWEGAPWTADFVIVWFTIGGFRDAHSMVRRLRRQTRDPTDDGVVREES